MKKIKEFFKEIVRQWKAETPKVAKWIRNISGIITAVVPSAWMTFNVMGILMPYWFSQNVGYITLAALLITGFAGTKEKKV